MNRYLAILLALGVSACSTTPSVTAQAPESPEAGPPTITVSASASVLRTPDVAVIQLAVETVAPAAKQASDENSAAMEAVLEAIRRLGVPSERIRTQRLELQPRYGNVRDEDPEIVAYRAVNQVTVRIEEIEGVGEVVDAAVRAGVNRVTGIQFEISDPEAAYFEALKEAVERAREEALVAASALGRTLEEALRVSTGGYDAPVRAARYDVMAMERAQAAPVQPGEMEIQARVTIVWLLGT